MIGAGKYDAACTLAREKAKAVGAILAVYEGEHGNGFSVQLPLEVIPRIPAVLRQMADDIEADLKRQLQ